MPKKDINDQGEQLPIDKGIDESLPCVLTEQEILSASRELARSYKVVQLLNDKKDEFLAQIKADIKREEASIELNSQKITTGLEYRLVYCMWSYLWEAGKKELRRMDTQELIRIVDISAEERQENLL